MGDFSINRLLWQVGVAAALGGLALAIGLCAGIVLTVPPT